MEEVMDPPEFSMGEVSFEGVSSENIEKLKTLNQVIFPINYPDRVYNDILACGEISQIALVRGRIIGGISCRLENSAEGPLLYIITLGVLAPYRNAGIGSKLLDMCLDTIRTCLPEVARARLHVQVSNEDAIRFYLKHGFVLLETIKNYYIRVEPRDAALLECKLHT